MKHWTGPVRSTAALCRDLGIHADPRLAELRDAGRLFVVRGDDGSVREMALRSTELEIDPETRGIDITASDETVDRYGDVIVAAGWQLDNYAKNPVILVDHVYRVASIVGTGEARIKGKKLKVRITHDTAEENQAAQMVIRLTEAGLLRAVSVGFLPLKWESIRDKDGNWTGYKFLEQDLMEVSWVAVPANPNATLSIAAPAGAEAARTAEVRSAGLVTRLLAAAAAVR